MNNKLNIQIENVLNAYKKRKSRTENYAGKQFIDIWCDFLF